MHHPWPPPGDGIYHLGRIQEAIFISARAMLPSQGGHRVFGTTPSTPRRTHHKRSLRVESSHLRKPSSTPPPSKVSCCATAGSTVGGRTQRRLASPACTWTQRRTPPCSPSSAEPQAFTTSPSPAP